ncbi:MAG: hypothetical protein TREMPRED_003663 [Tremellales sp. Tagirdzhanova-0007]|nr:MAG: hypothetical protein TREMPRED_003663 [Tremellales sp. Tagirdzhanova-0007]
MRRHSSTPAHIDHKFPMLRPVEPTPSLTSTYLDHPTPQPYMVALSGWPQPIYVSQPTVSRPTTPRSSQSTSSSISGTQGARSSVSAPTVISGPKESEISMYDTSDEVKHYMTRPSDHFTAGLIPSASQARRHRAGLLDRWDGDRRFQLGEGDKEEQMEKEDEDEDGPFPTSSTRGTPHPSPPGSSRLLPLPFPSRASKFSDPRYAPHAAPHAAVLHKRSALPLVPTWFNAPSSPVPEVALTSYPTPNTVISQESTPSLTFTPTQTPTSANMYTPTQTPTSTAETAPTLSTGSSLPAPATETRRQTNDRVRRRGSGILVMKTAPDVHQSRGLATEVYPRDPNATALWSRHTSRDEEASPLDDKTSLKG